MKDGNSTRQAHSYQRIIEALVDRGPPTRYLNLSWTKLLQKTGLSGRTLLKRTQNFLAERVLLKDPETGNYSLTGSEVWFRYVSLAKFLMLESPSPKPKEGLMHIQRIGGRFARLPTPWLIVPDLLFPFFPKNRLRQVNMSKFHAGNAMDPRSGHERVQPLLRAWERLVGPSTISEEERKRIELEIERNSMNFEAEPGADGATIIKNIAVLKRPGKEPSTR